MITHELVNKKSNLIGGAGGGGERGLQYIETLFYDGPRQKRIIRNNKDSRYLDIDNYASI